MDEFQAIYANVNGWGIQQASENLPADAAKTFTDYSTTLNRTFSQYKDLYQGAVYALKSDGKYAFCLQAVNDGTFDHSGRSNVRTHGFIFPLESNPDFYPMNRYLVSFSAQNFSDSLRQEDFIYDEPLPEITAAMEHCGFDTEKLEKLLRCVYALLLSGSEDTLHIRVPDQSYIRDCMLCIYQGLPYSIRKEVSYSNVPMTDGFATVTFLTPDFPEINRNLYFYDLLTGEENLLDAGTEADLDKHIAFHHYVCESVPYETELRDLLLFFQQQEEALHIPDTLGISVRLDLIHLICQMIKFDESRSEMTEKEILLLMMRLLNLQLESDYSNEILARLLQYCAENGVSINERVMASVQKKYAAAKDETLRQALFTFQCRQLLTLGKNDLCRQLFSSYQESPALFGQMAACIRANDSTPDQEFSTEAFDQLYADYIGRYTAPETLPQIRSFYAQVQQLAFAPHPFTDRFLKEQMLKAVGRFAAQSAAEKQFAPFWREWNEFLQSIVPEQNERLETVAQAKEAYWQAFRPEIFTEDETDFYRSMAADPERSETWRKIRGVIDLLRTDAEVSIRTYRSEAAAAVRSFEGDAARENLTGVLIRHARQIYTDPMQIDGWIAFLSELAAESKEGHNFYAYVFQYDIKLLYENADAAYAESAADKNEFAEYQRLIKEFAEQNSTYAAKANETADALKRVSKKKFGGIAGLFKKK